MSSKPQVKIGVNVLGIGCHAGAWRTGEVDPDAGSDIGYYQNVARIAERGCLDAIFLADSPGLQGVPAARPPMTMIEPTLILTAIAAVTERIGVVATVSTTFNHPYNIARRISSLDHVSHGRAGVNAVTTYNPAAVANFGLSEALDHVQRYDRADEFLDVVKELWDSWEDEAVIGDVKAARWLDPERLHDIDHHGRHFDVKGPLNLPRSPQGHPVVVQAGGSEQGRALAGRHAEAVFTSQLTLEDGQTYYADLKRRAKAAGRDPSTIKIMPGLTTVIGGTEAEAKARYARLEELAGGASSLPQLALTLGLDPGKIELDRPLPYDKLTDRLAHNGSHGFYDSFVNAARREDLTVRQLLARFSSGHRLAIGAPEQIADTIEEWVLKGAADGFNLMPDVFPTGVEAFVDHVVPLLRERGIFRHEYTGTTLRDHLGLPRPSNRYGVASGDRTASVADPALIASA
jgi:FMN-dependent oxidoreductase (nitrilotriacetate monooxygenase family)